MSAYFDFRSDTVTRPTEGMLRAMTDAAVGDDVFNEDPTVHRLEQMLASMFGHEAGLFCPSGTMTNQIAIRVHTRPGDAVICDSTAHIQLYEGGGMASNSGVTATLVPGEGGRMSAAQVEAAMLPDDVHFPKTRLLALENSCNRGGGTVYSLEQMTNVTAVARKAGLATHLDGARIFNAMAATGMTPTEVGPLFDSISICLSKGLGAPVGSVLLGSSAFIYEARRQRKVFGGGMRQAGYLAAAGIYALENHVARLPEDHKLAKLLAEGLAEIDCISTVQAAVTNIVVATLAKDWTPAVFLAKAKEQGVLAVPFGPKAVRFVTHLDVDEVAVEEAVARLQLLRL